MRRFNTNRVEATDDGVEPRNSFELGDMGSNTNDVGTYGRSRSMNVNNMADGEQQWSHAAQTVRRARSMHKNAHQNAINFLPSRHVTNIGAVGTKIPGIDLPLLADGVPETQEHQVQQIVHQMELVDDLMEDSPDAEEMRLETLRDLPQCLTVKRNIRAKITASVSRKSKHRAIGFFRRTKYRISFWRKKVKQNFRNLIFSFELWYGIIKSIEGLYGSGVATYFRFLRWLFIMNSCVSLMLVSFVVIPQALYAANGNETMQTTSFSFSDIFTGHGSFTNTTLYYGFYSPVEFSSSANYYYNIPYAYFFTMLIMYFTMFIVLSIRMARSYRVSFIETAGGFKNVYANKIFCGWDFGISSPQAATLKSSSLFNELKELLSDSYKVKYEQTSSMRMRRLFIKMLVHGFAVALLCLTGVLMVTLLDDTILDEPVVLTAIRSSSLLAVIVTLIMVVVPIIFSFIARFEQYGDPRTAIFITLIRTFALEVVVVAILVIFWLRSNDKCWETSLGQEVYRLIIFDFLFSIIGLPIIELLRSLISKFIWKKLGIPEFDIARNTLGLIYNQTLLWMGLFYSPLLCPIVAIKMFITFYVKRMCVQYTCQPSTKSWRAAQTQTFFLVLIFMSLLGVLLTMGYTFTGVLTGGCGPFVNFDYVYMMFVEGILNLKQGNTFFSIIMYISKPGVVAFILIAMCVAAYYLRAKSLAQKSMVDILRDMLVLESKDKEFLLDAIAKVTKGQWIYSQKEGENALVEMSSTWKYLRDADKMRKPSNAGFQFEVAGSAKKNPFDSPRASVGPNSPSGRPNSSGLQRDNSRRFQVDSPRSTGPSDSPANPSGLKQNFENRSLSPQTIADSPVNSSGLKQNFENRSLGPQTSADSSANPSLLRQNFENRSAGPPTSADSPANASGLRQNFENRSRKNLFDNSRAPPSEPQSPLRPPGLRRDYENISIIGKNTPPRQY